MSGLTYSNHIFDLGYVARLQLGYKFDLWRGGLGGECNVHFMVLIVLDPL